MSRRRGSVHKRDGQLYARLTWIKPSGQRASKEARIKTKTEGWQLINAWLVELEAKGQTAFDRSKATFNDLADYVRDNYFIEPVYRDGKRLSGSRTWKDRRSKLEIARAYFGRRLLKSITWGDLEKFKRERLQTPTWRNQDRAISTVNRELSTLRRAFSIARAEGWIDRNPFEQGTTPLIEVSHETKRDRILTQAEEKELLDYCELTPKCSHLRPILICALDTGMRQGEIFKLRVKDVDLAKRLLFIRSSNTKTQTARQVPISKRLLLELQIVTTGKRPGDLVFGITNHVKRSFERVCKRAKVAGLRFHDLRHTAATRWIEAGIPLPTVSRLLGHTSVITTYRYVNPTTQMLREALDAFDQQPGMSQSVSVFDQDW